MPTVRITWIDSVTAGVTGHKIYRDDVEVGDVGLLVQTYDDTTALAETTYKYEVQAYTDTGESVDETLGVNMDNITTAVIIDELYIEGDAVDYNNETNSTGSWGNQNGTLTAITDSYDGTYAISHIAGLSDSPRAELALALDDATAYQFKVWAKRGSGSSDNQQAIKIWEGFVSSPSTLISDTWTEYTFNITTNSSSQLMRFYSNSAGGTQQPDEIIFDKISIKKV